MRYSDIDPVLLPWAVSHSLHVQTRHHDEDIRAMAIVDDAGDIYRLGVGPDYRDPNFPDTKLAIVVVSLHQRGDKKHQAFFRERRRFTFEQFVPLTGLSAALDEAWQRAHEWISQSGHSRLNA